MEKKLKILISCIFVLIETVCFSQEWVSLNNFNTVQKPLIKIISSNQKETFIKITVKGFYKEEVKIDGDIYHKLRFPEYQTLNEIGMPALPIITELIGIPSNSRINVSIIDSSRIKLDGYKVYPYQKPLLENENAEKFHINNIFYSSSENFPVKSIYISKPMIWRDIKNSNMVLSPIKWNPQNGSLYILKEFTVKIEYLKEETTTPVTSKFLHIPERIKQMYKKHILNYNDNLFFRNTEEIQDTFKIGSALSSLKSRGIYSYLIITSPSYSNSQVLNELADWKSRIGLKCEIVATNETGSTSSEIKNYISNKYTNSNIEYVLFIGDHSDIPLHYWNSAYSDYWYGCLSGGDHEAEVAIGRFSVSDNDELKNMQTKTINYEKKPPINDWVERSLLIAHKQDAPGKYQGCKENIRTASYSITTPTFDKAYGAHVAQGGNDATNQTIINAINEGRGLVNYRGHGTITGWDSGWSYEGDEFNLDEIDDLTNGNETPVIFSIACHTGNIRATNDCFSENFTDVEQGAVSFLGATRTTYTNENHTLDKELYNHIYDDGFYNIGNVLIQANIQTLSYHSNNWGSRNNSEAYLWCGDPSLEIWTDTPSMCQFLTMEVV